MREFLGSRDDWLQALKIAAIAYGVAIVIMTVFVTVTVWEFFGVTY